MNAGRRANRFPWGAAALVAVCMLVAPTTALAAPPANDAFADAVISTIPTGGLNGTTTEATTEQGEPDGAGSGTVWYRVTPQRSMVAGICADSDAGVLAQPFLGSFVSGLTAPIEVTDPDYANKVRCPSGLGALVRFFSLTPGEASIQVSTAPLAAAFTLYVFDATAVLNCADSTKVVTETKKSIKQTKKQLAAAIKKDASNVGKLKRKLKSLKRFLPKAIEDMELVCSRV